MNQTDPKQRPMGQAIVQKYGSHARTLYGRLRHDLLYMYYAGFIEGRNIDCIFDVGGVSGFLVSRLIAARIFGDKSVTVPADFCMLVTRKKPRHV